jgi:hypothetical protein
VEGKTSEAGPIGRLAAWVKSHRLLSVAVGALVTASVGLVVDRFGPGILEDLTGEPPLRITVQEAPASYYEGNAAALPTGLPGSKAGYRGSCEDILRRLDEEGAVDVGESYLRVSVQGLHDSPVVIQDISARIVRRHEPIAHTIVSCPLEGQIDVISLGFDLDEPEPMARQYENDEFGAPYFGASAIRVDRGEPIEIDVIAVTEKCYCEWTMELVAIVDGEEETFVLDDNGQPFRTSASLYPPNEPQQRWFVFGGELMSPAQLDRAYSRQPGG